MHRSAAAAGGAAAAVLVLGLALLRPDRVVAQAARSPEQQRRVRTSGSATVTVKPDAARLFFAVTSIAANIKAARADNANKVKQVRTALAGLQIPDLKTKSSDVTVEMLTSEPEGRSLPKTTGYRVTHSFTVLITDSDQDRLSAAAGRVLDLALESGGTNPSQISFFKRETDEARRQALKEAVADALENARAMAAGAGASVTDTLRIEGTPSFGGELQQLQLNNRAVDDAPSALVAGDLQITCQVTVTAAY
jgi:uncharacterized protein YggE